MIFVLNFLIFFFEISEFFLKKLKLLNTFKTFYFLIDILARLVVVKRGFTCFF